MSFGAQPSRLPTTDRPRRPVVDAGGCARLEQKIRGPFRKPAVGKKPNALVALAGPALNLLKQAEDLLDGGKCEPFYTGSVPAPK